MLPRPVYHFDGKAPGLYTLRHVLSVIISLLRLVTCPHAHSIPPPPAMPRHSPSTKPLHTLPAPLKHILGPPSLTLLIQGALVTMTVHLPAHALEAFWRPSLLASPPPNQSGLIFDTEPCSTTRPAEKGGVRGGEWGLVTGLAAAVQQLLGRV